ncbi:hypothetical protein SAMN05216366_104154 [Selenomonas ruminantium]|uniref:Uncharacterized protein n=1 Tax=Selenomonas ruminantium TaxID=971 RepID=A0A1H0P873_SELRU|nr:hypothetical protein SAMN05216366_104154 [Selenomonas ruminantium]
MEKEKYTLIFEGEGNSVTVENLTLNGNNYVSESEVDLSSLPDVFALTVKDSNGNVVESHDNTKLLQQVKYDWDGGKYYLAFTALSQLDIDQRAQDSKIQFIAMMADIDVEEA